MYNIFDNAIIAAVGGNGGNSVISYPVYSIHYTAQANKVTRQYKLGEFNSDFSNHDVIGNDIAFDLYSNNGSLEDFSSIAFTEDQVSLFTANSKGFGSKLNEKFKLVRGVLINSWFSANILIDSSFNAVFSPNTSSIKYFYEKYILYTEIEYSEDYSFKNNILNNTKIWLSDLYAYMFGLSPLPRLYFRDGEGNVLNPTFSFAWDTYSSQGYLKVGNSISWAFDFSDRYVVNMLPVLYLEKDVPGTPSIFFYPYSFSAGSFEPGWYYGDRLVSITNIPGAVFSNIPLLVRDTS